MVMPSQHTTLSKFGALEELAQANGQSPVVFEPKPTSSAEDTTMTMWPDASHHLRSNLFAPIPPLLQLDAHQVASALELFRALPSIPLVNTVSDSAIWIVEAVEVSSSAVVLNYDSRLINLGSHIFIQAFKHLHPFWEVFGDYIQHVTVVFITGVAEDTSYETQLEQLNEYVQFIKVNQ